MDAGCGMRTILATWLLVRSVCATCAARRWMFRRYSCEVQIPNPTKFEEPHLRQARASRVRVRCAWKAAQIDRLVILRRTPTR